jgi:hypothetical protein
LISSVAKGPKFRPQSSKRAEKNLVPNLYPIYQKRAEKGPNFFLVWFFIKSSIFPAKNKAYKLVYLIFPYRFGSWTFDKNAKLAFVSQFYVGAELFHQRPNFLADPAENS